MEKVAELPMSDAAALALGAVIDLFLLDTRDFGDDGLQPHPLEWIEE
jgi:hypothetical protein